MRKLIPSLLVWLLLAGPAAWAENTSEGVSSSKDPAGAAPQREDPAQLRQEIEQLKKSLNALEGRLAAQEKQAAAVKEKVDASDETVSVKELDKRVAETERQQALDRVKITGDYRFEAHSIWGNVPAHFDGMQLQNLVVKTLFFANTNGGAFPTSVSAINNNVNNNYPQYLQFTNNLSFNQLKRAMGSFPAPMQQQLFSLLMPSTFVPAYKDNNKVLYTNRLRLNLDSRINEDISVFARLSMYKVFGDSTGVQVFNGQPNSFNIDGTTVGVPNSDILRVERAYFSWNHLGGSKAYLSIGRRPSTDGPPLNYRQDEPRGGTPSGAIIDYQFDGITFGYHFSDNIVWRLCYGVGYESGFGNGNILKLPQDRLKDVHFLGGNLDLWTTDKTLIQTTFAHAFNVTDGFNGLIVLPVNPVTGDPVNAPVVMRYTPSANLGGINLVSVNLTRRQGPVDLYVSGNYSGTRPNGITTPFGGLMSDPFEAPVDRNGYMGLVGVRYNFGNDERTKVGFEFNHGTKYWFNFAQAEDDIIAPKTNTRGNVFETYLTHRITQRFVFKADFIKYLYDYSGSGWHVGAPKKLDSTPVLGFPTYNSVWMATLGLTARF